MKRIRAILGTVLAFVGLVVSARAAEISPELAQQAVDAWLKRGQPVQGRTESAKTVVDPETGARINVVTLKGGGYVITAGDDLRGPVMAFAQSGTFDAEDGNPLWALLKGDARIDPVEANNARKLSSGAGEGSRTDEQRAWDDLLGKGSGPAKASSGVLPAGSVMRCEPMIKTKWAQTTHNGDSEESGGLPCYNYHCPVDVEYIEASPLKSSSRVQFDNLEVASYRAPCGCVATAAAQLMRYHRYPSRANVRKSQCWAFGDYTNMTVSGEAYAWSEMAEEPATAKSERTRRAIGRLTADVAIACAASFSRTSTSASVDTLQDRLVDTFKYAQAKWFSGYNATAFRHDVIPNLDARKPILLTLPGHLIVVDGYAWNSEAQGTLYVHANMGWKGSQDGWYVPPRIASYSLIQGVLGNIFKSDTGYIVSGRVLGTDGRPIKGAVVRLKDGNCVEATSKETDSQGIYSIICRSSLGGKAYDLEASCGSQSRTVRMARYYLAYNVLQDITLPVEVVVADPVVTCTKGTAQVLVTMTCPTPDVQIRYSTNRSVPTDEVEDVFCKSYEGPFYIYGSTTFKVLAYKSGFKSSSVVTYRYDHGAKSIGDDFQSAPMLPSTTEFIVFNNDFATSEDGDPYIGGDGKTVWAAFTAPEAGNYVFSASAKTSDGEFLNTKCAACFGSSMSELRVMSRGGWSYEDSPSKVSLMAERGKTYRIAMDTYDGSGDIALSWRKCEVVAPEETAAEVGSSAGSGRVTVRSSCRWEVTDCPSWITVWTTNGPSGGLLEYSYAQNESCNGRTGVISLRAGDSEYVDYVVRQKGVGWAESVREAEALAYKYGRRIVMVYGRDGCLNTTSARYDLSATVDVRALVDQGYVCWYCNCDGARSREAEPYTSGMGSYILPCIAIIDPVDMSKFLVRTTGYQSASAIKSMLQTYLSVNPNPQTSVTVSFDGNGGTVGTASRTYPIGTPYGTLSTAVQSGYVFSGWYTEADGGTKVEASEMALPSATRLYAHWRLPAPANDDFSSAYALGGSSGSVTASNVGATYENGEPMSSYYSTTIWWAWTAPASGTVRFDTIGSSFDTVMGVCAGTSLSSLVKIAENDDSAGSCTSMCEFDCTAGTRYFIVVTGYGGAEGTVKLQWSQTASAAVDIYFESEGDTAVSSRAYTIGEPYGTLPTMTRAGYLFEGWYTSATDGERVTASTLVSSRVNRLYAHWIKQSYLTFYHFNNGGGDVVKNQKVGCAESQALHWVNSQLGWANPAGKTFLGWSTSASSGLAKYVNGERVQDLAAAGEAVNLYAVWCDAKTDYVVRFHRNASGTDTTVAQQRLKAGVSTSLAWKDSGLGWTAAPAGKTFLGWGAAANATVAKWVNGATVKDLATAGKTVDLYAVWRPANTYVVTFHRNVPGGDATTASQWLPRGVSTSLVWTGSQLGWAPAGYTFLGWAESADGAIKYANGAKVTDLAAAGGMKHLYAKWKGNAYTVRFHYNYGTDRTANQAFAYGTEQALRWLGSGLKWEPPEGAVFLGWAESANGAKKYANGAKVKNLTAANGGVVHLYAKWNLITVRFHKNAGGTDVTATQTFRPGVAQNLTWKDSGLKWANPAGKVFVGWGTAANAAFAVYANGAKVTDPAPVGNTLDLYAVWAAADSYIVKFYRNYTSTDATVAYQGVARTTATALVWTGSQLGWANPSGRTFLGWAKTRTATAGTYANGAKVTGLGAKGGTVALYAVWSAPAKSAKRESASSSLQGGTASVGNDETSPVLWLPDYICGIFADGSGTFDLLLGEFAEDGVAEAFFAATTEDGFWTEECEAMVVDETLFLTFEDAAPLVICYDEREGCYTSNATLALPLPSVGSAW